jgi:hypothetical protein
MARTTSMMNHAKYSAAAIRASLEDAQYSRCLLPTCSRLLQVMPEDVSPRDNRDQDHAQRDRFEILCELRRVHARPPLRQPVIDEPDCLPRQLEEEYRKGKLLQTGLWRYTRHPNYLERLPSGGAFGWWRSAFRAVGLGSLGPSRSPS